MEKSFNLLEYYPDRWRELKEVQAICDSDVTEIDGSDNIHTLQHLWECLETDLNNVFILPYGDNDGANEMACERWESMLGIVPTDDMTLDDRQFVIYTKLFQTTPYSYRNLQNILTDLIGNDGFTLSRNVEDKWLIVVVNESNKFKANAVKELIENITPVDMRLNVTISMTPHGYLEKYTHDDLDEYTHKEITTLTELE